MFRRFLGGLCVVGILLPLAGCASTESPSDLQPTVLLIGIDGFRWDYALRAETPTLDALSAAGVRADLIPVFPSKTFPNHYSIATGLYPENHGIVENTMYDPVFDETFSLGNREAVQDGRWWADGEPIWVTAEQQGQTTATFFWPGTEAEIRGTRPTHWYPYDGRIPNRDRVQQILDWLDLPTDQRPTLLTLYFSTVDSEGHAHGPLSDELIAAVEDVDALLGELVTGLKARGLLDQVNMLITSDHGMAELSRDRMVFLDDYIAMDDVEVVVWSPVAALIPKAGRADAVYAQLQTISNLQVYKKEEVPERYHYRNHRRIMPLIAVADLGWSITTRGYFANNPTSFTGGMHGYDPAQQEMHSLFLAHGPAFKSGASHPPFENIHLYNLMTHLLGLTAAPNDGDFEAVRAMLRNN